MIVSIHEPRCSQSFRDNKHLIDDYCILFKCRFNQLVHKIIHILIYVKTRRVKVVLDVFLNDGCAFIIYYNLTVQGW